MRLSWKNDGQETITVPAGTYENAYRVKRTSEVEASLNLEGMTGRGTLTVETIHWFAPYVGLLKSEVDSARLSVMGISFPIEAAGSSLELVEYKP